MMKKTLGVLLPLAAAMSFALPASAAVSELSAEEAAIYRTQMDANIQAVKQQQEQIEAEARARAEVRQKAQAAQQKAKQEAENKAKVERARAERIRAQREAELAKAKAERQAKLDAYSDYKDTYGQNYCTMVALMDAVTSTLTSGAVVS